MQQNALGMHGECNGMHGDIQNATSVECGYECVGMRAKAHNYATYTECNGMQWNDIKCTVNVTVCKGFKLSQMQSRNVGMDVWECSR